MSTIVHLLLEVQKEPTNEMPDWKVPDPSTVADFIARRSVQVETDDGWFIASVSEELQAQIPPPPGL